MTSFNVAVVIWYPVRSLDVYVVKVTYAQRITYAIAVKISAATNMTVMVPHANDVADCFRAHRLLTQFLETRGQQCTIEMLKRYTRACFVAVDPARIDRDNDTTDRAQPLIAELRNGLGDPQLYLHIRDLPVSGMPLDIQRLVR